MRLELSLNDSLPIFKFDYQKVQQAVANLLDNALKHTPAGGSRQHAGRDSIFGSGGRLKRRLFRIAGSAHSGHPNSVRVRVTDTGPGIASEHHQEIFEDFVRVDRTSSGMGLGLAIAKRLIQAHRGKIWVESEPRRGCVFTFLLPTDESAIYSPE